MLEIYPGACEVKDKEQQLPLHCAWHCAKKSFDEVVLVVLKAGPAAAGVKSRQFGLLTHWACISKPVAFVSAIVALYPEGVAHLYDVETWRGAFSQPMTMLHWSVLSKASYELTLTLAKACPSAASIKCAGRMPLHNAVEMGVSVEIVDCLLEAFPGATKVRVGQGKSAGLPLHWACRPDSKALIATVKTLLDVDSSAAKEVDGAGKLPLRFCYEWDAPAEMTNLLHDAYPEAAEVMFKKAAVAQV
jgi:hypothetical protein